MQYQPKLKDFVKTESEELHSQNFPGYSYQISYSEGI